MTLDVASKKKRNLLKVSIVLSSIDGQVQAALYVPILALISQTFSESVSLVNFAYSITSGVMVVTILIAGNLAKVIDKRTLMITGTILFMLGGFLGSFSPNAYVLIATRALEGVGAGLVYPMVPAITAQLFDGRERTQLLGMTNGGACLIAFFLNFGSGLAGALFGWRVCLYIYAILIVAVVMQVKYIPKLGPERNLLGNKSEDGKKMRVPAFAYWIALAVCAIEVFGQVFNMLLSGFILDTGIGTSVVAGTANSVQVLVGVLVGFLFARIVKALGNFVPALALGMNAIAYLGLSLSHSAVGVYLSMACLGICYGIMFPYFNDCVARRCSHATVTLGMTYVSMGMLIGSFLITFFVDFLRFVTDGSYVSMFTVVSVGFFAVAALFLIIGIIRTIRNRGGRKDTETSAGQ